MDLRVVGGFLGSGKTTAIVSALHTLIAAGQRVGVITNDKGRFLVETAFIGSTGVWPRQGSLAVASGATTVTSGTVSRSSSAMLSPMCCLPSP